MGTNYYWHEKPPCECCKRAYEPKHIGKSSMGWCFSLHVIPDEDINDLPDWERIWASGGYIEDEYGKRISIPDMRLIIMARNGRCDEEKKWSTPPFGYASWGKFHLSNYSEKGRLGLVRHRIGKYCTKHGDGTWDCMPGEFS